MKAMEDELKCRFGEVWRWKFNENLGEVRPTH